MPRFKYKARKSSGELVLDHVEADSPVAVAKRLSGAGMIPLSIDREEEAETSTRVFQRISTTEVIMFTRQLVTLYKAGLPFLSSLDAIEQQTANPALRRVIARIHDDVEGGKALSAALAEHPKAFSRVYVSTVVAGETGGVLDQVLDRLVLLLENEAETKKTIKGLLRYPATVIAAMVVAFLVIVTFVIPTFSKMFAKAGADLPLPTRIMMGINTVRQGYWHVCLLAAAVVIGGAVWYVRSPVGRLRFHRFLLKLPLVGSIMMKVNMARLGHLFGTLSESGLPILKELQVVAHTLGNQQISNEVDAVRNAVHEGSTLASAVEEHTQFPPLVKHMIAVGEKTGAMGEMMRAAGDHYDRETKAEIARATHALEPLITVVLALGLLFMALAVFLPMWDMMKVMGAG
ncbi:MAG: type II secretion system F family protein [Planctomycetota bacterium]